PRREGTLHRPRRDPGRRHAARVQASLVTNPCDRPVAASSNRAFARRSPVAGRRRSRRRHRHRAPRWPPAGPGACRKPAGRASLKGGSSSRPRAGMAARHEVVLGVLFGGVLAPPPGTLAALLERAQCLQARMRLAKLVRARIDRALEVLALLALGFDRLIELAPEPDMHGQPGRARQRAEGRATIVTVALPVLLERVEGAARPGAGLLRARAAGGGHLAIAIGHFDELLEHCRLHVLASSFRSGAWRSGAMPSAARAVSDASKSHWAARSCRRKRPMAGATSMARSISGSEP